MLWTVKAVLLLFLSLHFLSLVKILSLLHLFCLCQDGLLREEFSAHYCLLSVGSLVLLTVCALMSFPVQIFGCSQSDPLWLAGVFSSLLLISSFPDTFDEGEVLTEMILVLSGFVVSTVVEK